MGLLQKLKAALGMDGGGRSGRRTEPDVTVEHEPATASERAVKTDQGPGAATTPDADAADAADESDAAADPSPADDSPSVEEITGIGQTYADRLRSAGIETVADLAEADLGTVVEAAQTNESRAEDWLEQARRR